MTGREKMVSILAMCAVSSVLIATLGRIVPPLMRMLLESKDEIDETEVQYEQ